MRLPGPIEAFVAMAKEGEGFDIRYAGWRLRAPHTIAGQVPAQPTEKRDASPPELIHDRGDRAAPTPEEIDALATLASQIERDGGMKPRLVYIGDPDRLRAGARAQGFQTPAETKAQHEATYEIGRQAGRIEAELAHVGDDPVRIAVLAKNLGVKPEELERAMRRRPAENVTAPAVVRPRTDVASLSETPPTFDEDPLVEDDGAERAPLTDKARSEFAAATAPPPDHDTSS